MFRYLKLQKAKKYRKSEEHRLRIKYATMSELGREHVKTFEDYCVAYRLTKSMRGFSAEHSFYRNYRYLGLHKNATESQILAVKIPHYMDWYSKLQLGRRHCCISRSRSIFHNN